MYEQMFNFSYVQFLALYNEFTLSIQGKYGNCTRVYKGTYVEGFQILLKNWLAHFPFLRMGDIPHTHFLFPFVHIHWMSYHSNDE